MKKLFILLTVIVFFTDVSACDICGCGVGSSYIGLLPEFKNRIFGLRYRHNSLFTHIGVNGASTYLTTKENYNIIEAWGAWNVSSRFRVMATIPYTFNERENQGVHTHKNGIGDISAIAYYRLLQTNKLNKQNNEFAQSLWLGAGIKLPAGRYNPQDKSAAGTNSNLFQSGTGSTDFTINALYDVSIKNTGLALSGFYKINTANKYNYTYGNKISLSAQFYHKEAVNSKLMITPNAGLLYENAKQDVDNGFKTTVSGGNSLLAAAGAEISFKKIAIGGSFQTPLSQNLAHGIMKGNNRFMLHAAVAI